jgi:hypothetical protein
MRFSFVLWVLLVLLGLILMSTPTEIRLDYFFKYPVQSVYVFKDFFQFAIMWHLLFGIALLFILARRMKDFGKVAALSIFGLVFAGFWALSTRGYIAEPFAFGSDVKYILETGRLANQLYYGGYPGISLLISCVSQLIGFQIFDTLTFLSLFQIFGFVLITFVLFKGTLGEPRLASFAVLLAMLGDIGIGDRLGFLHPGALSPFVLFPTLLLLLQIRRSSQLKLNPLLLSIILVAITIVHFMTSIFVVLSMLGFYIVGKLSKENLVDSRILIMSAIPPLAWQMYGIGTGFSPFILAIQGFQQFTSEFALKLTLTVNTTSYAPARIPLWVTLVIDFWLFFVAFGLVLGLTSLLHVRKLDTVKKLEVGGILASVITGAIFLLSLRLGDALFRPLVYVAFFTVPITLRFLSNMGIRRKKNVSLALVTLLFFLSFPTFLAYNKDISLMCYSGENLSAGQFLESRNPASSGLQVYSVTGRYPYIQYYLLGTIQSNIISYENFRSLNESSLWENLNSIITNFENSGNEQSILMFSPEWRVPFQAYFGQDPTIQPEWKALTSRILGCSIIYDNGQIQIIPRQP